MWNLILHIGSATIPHFILLVFGIAVPHIIQTVYTNRIFSRYAPTYLYKYLCNVNFPPSLRARKKSNYPTPADTRLMPHSVRRISLVDFKFVFYSSILSDRTFSFIYFSIFYTRLSFYFYLKNSMNNIVL